MVGMNLKFLNNPSQRIATGKSMPLKQLEAIVAYGSAEQRAKVVAKVLPQCYTLSLHKSTHFILTTILKHCDNLVRAQFLYNIRRNINDMARSPCGNIIVQQLIEFLPNAQRREIAEAFVLNTEEGELELAAKHPFANHVIQKLMEYPASSDVLIDHVIPLMRNLVVHPIGQRTVAKLIEHAATGASHVVSTLFPSGGDADDEMSALDDILNGVSESLVLSTLLKHPSVDVSIKDAIIAALIERAAELTSLEASANDAKSGEADASYAEPDFIGGGSNNKQDVAGPANDKAAGTQSNSGRHNFAFASAIEHGDDAQRKELYSALKPFFSQFAETKGQVTILLAFFKFADAVIPECRSAIVTAVLGESSTTAVQETPAKGKGGRKPAAKKAASTVSTATCATAADAATHSVKSVLLRTMLEMDASSLESAGAVDAWIKAAPSLAVSAVAGPLLQKVAEYGSEVAREGLFHALESNVEELCDHPCGCYLVQAMLEHLNGKTKETLVSLVSDYIVENPVQRLSTAQGSRVMQKLVAYGSDETVRDIIDAIADGEDDEGDDDDAEEAEEEEGEEAAAEEADQKQLSRKEQREANRKKHYKIRDNRVLSYAVHNHACFAIQALLREAKSRQLNDQRKRLMNALKPHVFDLAVSPWAGRVVLDTMLVSGSAELQAAIKNVVFMKAESWLSDVPVHAKGQAGIDPTMRQALRRDRDNDASSGNDRKKIRTEEKTRDTPAEGKKPNKKIHRFLKK
mmetsp:Transcript_62961/g.73276  ORF Transcript_62961/g.73276 Transcript_62961/m.73276 type:complete len:747 (-) Transcript_62961:216-2456(-)